MKIKQANSTLGRVFLSLLLGLGVIGAGLVLPASADAACPTMPTDKGSVTLVANAPSADTFFIWSRNRTPSTSSRSYYLQVDNNCGVLVGGSTIPTNSWTWVNYHDGNTDARMAVGLTAGQHTFKLYGVDPNLIVDRLILTADGTCSPTGTGDNCLNTYTPENPTPPVIITPGGGGSSNTVNGTIKVGSANGKSTVVIDGKTVAAGNGLLDIDTSDLSDGYHTITIQTTNPDGTTSTIVRRILVQNNKHWWNRAYGRVFAAMHYNQWATKAVVLAAAIAFMTSVGVVAYGFWSMRLWEAIPLVNKIHFRFLHLPTFLKALDPARPAEPAFQAPVILGTDTLIGDIHGSYHPAQKHLTLRGHTLNFNLRAVTEVAAFAVVGSALVLFAVAGANSFSVEPEAGTKTGVTVTGDSGASGGSYIQFGTGTVPPPPTCPVGQIGTPPNCVTPPPPFSSQCLARSGNRININGAQPPPGYRDYSVAPNNIYNATNATWTGQMSWMITIEGNGPACWYGGVFQGTWDDTSPTVTWQNPYHHSGGFTNRVPNLLIEGLRGDNQGDGLVIDANGTNFHARALYLSNIHDDCIQNDALYGGLVEDSLFDGCYTGISEDDFTKTKDGSANTLTFQNNLMYIKAMNTVYRGTAPGVGILFKGWWQTPSTKVVLKNNVFYAAQLPGFSTNALSVPAGMNITDCSNNIFVWTGPGDRPPGNFPSCFSFTKDVSVWNNAVTKWKTDHPSIH